MYKSIRAHLLIVLNSDVFSPIATGAQNSSSHAEYTQWHSLPLQIFVKEWVIQ